MLRFEQAQVVRQLISMTRRLVSIAVKARLIVVPQFHALGR